MSSIMRRRRGLKSAISILLSEGDGLQHPHPLSQEAIYATLPLTPRQRLRSIIPPQLSFGCPTVSRLNQFAREAAAALLRMAKTTKDPTVAAGLVQRAADLKDRTGELPAIDVEAMAEEPRKPLTKN